MTHKTNQEIIAEWVGQTDGEYEEDSYQANLKRLADKIKSLSIVVRTAKTGDYDGADLTENTLRGGANVGAMTIREEFASRALSGLLSDPSTGKWDHPQFSAAAVSHADALLLELSK